MVAVWFRSWRALPFLFVPKLHAWLLGFCCSIGHLLPLLLGWIEHPSCSPKCEAGKTYIRCLLVRLVPYRVQSKASYCIFEDGLSRFLVSRGFGLRVSLCRCLLEFSA